MTPDQKLAELIHNEAEKHVNLRCKVLNCDDSYHESFNSYVVAAEEFYEIGRASMREEVRELVEAAWNILLRIDHNGGVGEYKGGPAFVVEPLRKALKPFAESGK